MLRAGVSQIPILFSLTSAPPAAPTSYISSGSHEHARSVAQGHAVVGMPVSVLRRRPAGPSAVGIAGVLSLCPIGPKQPVFATPVGG